MRPQTYKNLTRQQNVPLPGLGYGARHPAAIVPGPRDLSKPGRHAAVLPTKACVIICSGQTTQDSQRHRSDFAPASCKFAE